MQIWQSSELIADRKTSSQRAAMSTTGYAYAAAQMKI